MSNSTNETRRAFLRLAGAATLTSLTAGCLGLGGGGGGSVDKTIYLGAKVPGWQGIYPNAIDGKANPTMQLTAGNTYKIDWVNLDGKKHEIIIENKNGEHVVASDHATKKGMSKSITFEATSDVKSYFCEYHPNSMRGKVSVSE